MLIDMIVDMFQVLRQETDRVEVTISVFYIGTKANDMEDIEHNVRMVSVCSLSSSFQWNCIIRVLNLTGRPIVLSHCRIAVSNADYNYTDSKVYHRPLNIDLQPLRTAHQFTHPMRFEDSYNSVQIRFVYLSVLRFHAQNNTSFILAVTSWSNSQTEMKQSFICRRLRSTRTTSIRRHYRRLHRSIDSK